MPLRGLAAAATLVALSAAGAALPAAGAAQEPDTLPAADTLPVPGPPEARPPAPAAVAGAAASPYAPPRFALSVTLGTPGLGELQTQPITAERLGPDGAATETQALDRALAVEDAVHVGVSALLGLSPGWAVRAGASWGSATLAAGYAGEEAFEEAAAGIGAAATDLTILAFEGALRFRMLSSRRIQPYAELGAGVLRIEAENPAFPGAAALTGETSLAGLAALGAIVPLTGPLAARLQASGQFFRTPAVPAPAGGLVGAVDTLRLTFMAPGAAPFADPVRELVRALRLELGLSLELGRAGRRRGAPVARPSGARP